MYTLPPGTRCLAGAGPVHWRSAVLAIFLLAAPAAHGLEKTPHNMTVRGEDSDRTSAKEVCVFCHPPVGDTEHAKRPSWDRHPYEKTWYQSFDTLGQGTNNDVGSEISGSVSVACLSCHDGAQAPLIGELQDTGGAEHPVMIPYGWFSSSNPDLRNVNIDGSARETKRRETNNPNFRKPTQDKVNGREAWWIDNGKESGRQKEDIPLKMGARGIPFVECSSCHDPHGSTTTFLRIENINSSLCLSCHEI